MNHWNVTRVIDSLRDSLEGIDDEVSYQEFGCCEASSIVALAFLREGWPSSLIRGVLYYQDGTIIVPHYWISLNVFDTVVIIDLTLHSWITNIDALSSVCVFALDTAVTAGLRYQGEPSPEDVNDIDHDVFLLSKDIFFDSGIAKSLT